MNSDSSNPYAAFLGDRDPIDVISHTPQQLRSLSDTIGPRRAEEPRAPGKWSTREILCHLADCELAFGFRLRQALAEEDHVIQPFDQEKWAKPYRVYNGGAALDVFSSVRNWNLALIRASANQFSKKVTHPERGEMTFEVLVKTMAGHDLNHLRQLEEIASRSAQAS